MEAGLGRSLEIVESEPWGRWLPEVKVSRGSAGPGVAPDVTKWIPTAANQRNAVIPLGGI